MDDTQITHKDPQPTNSTQLTGQVRGADTFSGVHEVTLPQADDISFSNSCTFISIQESIPKLMSTEADVNPTSFYLGNTKEICQNARFLSLMFVCFQKPQEVESQGS